ncbi:MAG: bifunctional oligoribonuclease/PAP phosphatase NrnA [Clostridiales bacterium]|nr:bifunctional oligoribonuclease/PAP phosphatase NrnA [Clostridiales bacterium]
MTTLTNIAIELKKRSNVLIFCHNRPDGDTLGSAFALKHALEQLEGKVADVVCAQPVPEKYLPLEFIGKTYLPSEITKKYDCHIAVDCASEMMLGDSYALFIKNENTINVDHHVSNERYAKLNYVEDRASCCEIIYGLINYLGRELSEEVANSLLLGIVTDTGNFMHNNVTESTLQTASSLVGKGANLHLISYAMFKNQKIERAKLYANTINNIRFFEDGKIAIISIFKSDFKKFYATQDMTEGFIDFPLSIEGVEVAVSIMESKRDTYKVSFRSKGKINVNEVASSFGGGGHVNASGCVVCGFYEDVKDKIIRAIAINF